MNGLGGVLQGWGRKCKKKLHKPSPTIFIVAVGGGLPKKMQNSLNVLQPLWAFAKNPLIAIGRGRLGRHVPLRACTGLRPTQLGPGLAQLGNEPTPVQTCLGQCYARYVSEHLLSCHHYVTSPFLISGLVIVSSFSYLDWVRLMLK